MEDRARQEPDRPKEDVPEVEHDENEAHEAHETPESSGGEPFGDAEPESDEGRTLEEIAAERDEYLERWKRAQADYKNLRRRGLAELEAGVRRGLQPLLENLLLVLDHLDMALSSPVTSQDAENLAMGVRMTRDQLVSALEREDVHEIDTSGPFDPELHQAVAVVDTGGAPPGSIVDVVRKGYRWKETVLRPAHVRVASRGEDSGGGGGEESGRTGPRHPDGVTSERD